MSAKWKDHQLQRVEILATVPNDFKVKVPSNVTSVSVEGKAVEIKDGIVIVS